MGLVQTLALLAQIYRDESEACWWDKLKLEGIEAALTLFPHFSFVSISPHKPLLLLWRLSIIWVEAQSWVLLTPRVAARVSVEGGALRDRRKRPTGRGYTMLRCSQDEVRVLTVVTEAAHLFGCFPRWHGASSLGIGEPRSILLDFEGWPVKFKSGRTFLSGRSEWVRPSLNLGFFLPRVVSPLVVSAPGVLLMLFTVLILVLVALLPLLGVVRVRS